MKAEYLIAGMFGVLALSGAFAAGRVVGMDEAKPKEVDRRVVAHHTHNRCEAVQRDMKILACRECGVVFVPSLAGIAMGEKDWNMFWAGLDTK